MKRRGFQISRRHRFLLYTASLVLFLSGISWAWIQHLDEAGRAGDGLVRMKPWLIAVHGFSAMLFVLLLGTLLVGHVRRAWHARKNRKNGVFFLTAVCLLTLSGYALYYLGDENWRSATSNIHLWLGVVMPMLLLLHIWFGYHASGHD
jgi:hypothetical protein